MGWGGSPPQPRWSRWRGGTPAITTAVIMGFGRGGRTPKISWPPTANTQTTTTTTTHLDPSRRVTSPPPPPPPLLFFFLALGFSPRFGRSFVFVFCVCMCVVCVCDVGVSG
ncbi:hypothetical protein Scep_006947 [Stephania cephalantha]|uniref:Uncharacterized protein n=1 Tax=Stephania cephalantha TaxID=152367 RepID=A0AAP0KA52_9MAGN